MKPVIQQSACELLVLLRTKKISSLDLANEYIRQIERLNPFLNALVERGVAVCGVGAVQPLAGRTEGSGPHN